MMTPEQFLQELGLSTKEQLVYISLLKRGPSSVREIAEASGLNRGTTYDMLKALQESGLVSYFDQAKKTYFSAEDPKRLQEMLSDRQTSVETLKKELPAVVSQLQSTMRQGGTTKPVARYFHGAQAIRTILQEVLDDVVHLEEKEYFVYSSASIAKHLYDAIPNFTKLRIKAGVRVSVIGLGNGGTTNEDLSQRRWLTREIAAPTYTIIFGRKTAFISLDEHEKPQGVIIEDPNLAQTQRLLFKATWSGLVGK
jgi:sugar-specific transcriptional regulator TrmB